MRHKLAFAVVLAVTGLAGSRSALAANSGRTLGATVSGTIFQYPIWQGPDETLRFFTSNLSAGSDTVIHVQNAEDGYNGFLAGNDDVAPGNLASDVTVPPTGSLRQLLVLVRAYSSVFAGSCTLNVDSSSWGGWNAAVPSFGGARFWMGGSLQTGSHVWTVERQGGTGDTVILTLASAAHAVAFDDNGGTGLMSFVHNPEPAGWGEVVLGNFADTGNSTVDVVWDDDVHWTDTDSDRLGATLESLICASGSCLNSSSQDSDGDGLTDGDELLGIDVGTPVKLPTWGADALQKDVFVEIDWKKCNSTSSAADKCPQGADSGKMGAGKTDAQFKTDFIDPLKADLAQGGFRIHLDVGRANTDPATWTDWGDWGGATQIASADPGGPGSEGASPWRDFNFHHAVSFPPEDGYPIGHISWIPGPFFTVSVNAKRIMAHEMGHGFGLMHGGRPFAKAMNYKPHYRSFMNYIYNWDGPSFSQGNAPVPNLNPWTLNEWTGLGTTAGTQALTKLRDAWCQVTPYSSGKCVKICNGGTPECDSISGDPGVPGLPIGAVDWNRDGTFAASGTNVQGAVTMWENTGKGTSEFTAGVLKDAAMTWVNLANGAGTQLFVFGRNNSDRLVWTKTSQVALNTGCGSFSGPIDEFGPYNCAGFGAPANTNLTPGSLMRAPGVAEYGSGATKQILLVMQRSQGSIVSSLVSINSSGVPSFGSDIGLPSPVIASGDITAVAVAPTDIRVYAPHGTGSGARLREWRYLNGSWFDSGDQKWVNGTFIVPKFGVGATRGYQDTTGTAETYAAIPTWPDGLVEFARKDANGWAKVTHTCPAGSFGCVNGVASTWAGIGGAGLAPGGTQPRAAARPGLAYQMRSGMVITTGRFYMAINQSANCSGPFGTPSGTPAGCPSVLIMTEGNLAAGTPTTRRLRWITPAQGLVGNFPVGGISLLDDLSRDVNLRVLITGADGKARFMPLADGIINTSISDMDDRPYVTGGLRASLCRDGGTWPWGCVLPPSLP